MHEEVGGVVKEYLYAPVGQELSIVDGNQNLLQGETYFGGRYLGTATPSWFNYAYADGQGTVRKRSNGELDSNWPFGEFANYQNGVSPIHFTGKLRDTETNLDYFGARYYSSQLGRWPDWSDSPEPVPYANLANPRSLNLYSYVLNNPATATDPDGHICFLGIGNTCSKATPKEGPVTGTATVGTADEVLGGIDTQAILAGLRSGADAVVTGASGIAGNAIDAAGGALGAVLTFSQPLDAGEDQILARRDAQVAGVQKKLGGLAGRAGDKVRDVIRSRGGTASNVNEVSHWADKTLGEAAQAAANGDRSAEKCNQDRQGCRPAGPKALGRG